MENDIPGEFIRAESLHAGHAGWISVGMAMLLLAAAAIATSVALEDDLAARTSESKRLGIENHSLQARLQQQERAEEQATGVALRELQTLQKSLAAAHEAMQRQGADLTSDRDALRVQRDALAAELRHSLNRHLASAVDARDALLVAAKNKSADRRSRASRFQLSFAELAWCVTTLTIAGELAPLEPVRRFVERCAADDATLTLVGPSGSHWFDLAVEERSSDGIALYGRVDAIAPQGAWLEMQLRVPGRANAINVATPLPPFPTFHRGDRVLVLGRIVDSPQDRLASYSGSASRVVRAGLVQVVAAAEAPAVR